MFNIKHSKDRKTYHFLRHHGTWSTEFGLGSVGYSSVQQALQTGCHLNHGDQFCLDPLVPVLV